ncbi:MAG: hypothetical protein HUJ51_03990, partial [Eggerthellaceae bacterium]|nr:hypothetical protein [Eggerthellaceae bacterium]
AQINNPQAQAQINNPQAQPLSDETDVLETGGVPASHLARAIASGSNENLVKQRRYREIQCQSVYNKSNDSIINNISVRKNKICNDNNIINDDFDDSNIINENPIGNLQPQNHTMNPQQEIPAENVQPQNPAVGPQQNTVLESLGVSNSLGNSPGGSLGELVSVPPNSKPDLLVSKDLRMTTLGTESAVLTAAQTMRNNTELIDNENSIKEEDKNENDKEAKQEDKKEEEINTSVEANQLQQQNNINVTNIGLIQQGRNAVSYRINNLQNAIDDLLNRINNSHFEENQRNQLLDIIRNMEFVASNIASSSSISYVENSVDELEQILNRVETMLSEAEIRSGINTIKEKDKKENENSNINNPQVQAQINNIQQVQSEDNLNIINESEILRRINAVPYRMNNLQNTIDDLLNSINNSHFEENQRNELLCLISNIQFAAFRLLNILDARPSLSNLTYMENRLYWLEQELDFTQTRIRWAERLNGINVMKEKDEKEEKKDDEIKTSLGANLSQQQNNTDSSDTDNASEELPQIRRNIVQYILDDIILDELRDSIDGLRNRTNNSYFEENQRIELLNMLNNMETEMKNLRASLHSDPLQYRNQTLARLEVLKQKLNYLDTTLSVGERQNLMNIIVHRIDDIIAVQTKINKALDKIKNAQSKIFPDIKNTVTRLINYAQIEINKAQKQIDEALKRLYDAQGNADMFLEVEKIILDILDTVTIAQCNIEDVENAVNIQYVDGFYLDKSNKFIKHNVEQGDNKQTKKEENDIKGQVNSSINSLQAQAPNNLNIINEEQIQSRINEAQNRINQNRTIIRTLENTIRIEQNAINEAQNIINEQNEQNRINSSLNIYIGGQQQLLISGIQERIHRINSAQCGIRSSQRIIDEAEREIIALKREQARKRERQAHVQAQPQENISSLASFSSPLDELMNAIPNSNLSLSKQEGHGISNKETAQAADEIRVETPESMLNRLFERDRTNDELECRLAEERAEELNRKNVLNTLLTRIIVLQGRIAEMRNNMAGTNLDENRESEFLYRIRQVESEAVMTKIYIQMWDGVAWYNIGNTLSRLDMLEHNIHTLQIAVNEGARIKITQKLTQLVKRKTKLQNRINVTLNRIEDIRSSIYNNNQDIVARLISNTERKMNNAQEQLDIALHRLHRAQGNMSIINEVENMANQISRNIVDAEHSIRDAEVAISGDYDTFYDEMVDSDQQNRIDILRNRLNTINVEEDRINELLDIINNGYCEIGVLRFMIRNSIRQNIIECAQSRVSEIQGIINRAQHEIDILQREQNSLNRETILSSSYASLLFNEAERRSIPLKIKQETEKKDKK